MYIFVFYTCFAFILVLYVSRYSKLHTEVPINVATVIGISRLIESKLVGPT